MVVKPQRILWPTDFSPLSLHGARYARGFCEVFDAVPFVIHVIQPLATDLAVTLPTEVALPIADDGLADACRARLAEVSAEQFAGLPVKTELLFGNPWSAICRYAQDAEIDLAVISTHGRTGLQRVVIGSTAERIVQHAPCPVLVVKLDAKDFVAD
jgi:nucleotide-binding universal stress UspA family protein